jgi:hypothetical protein
MVSRWCVARQSAGGKLERISAIVYATDLSQAGPVLQPVEMPRSRKGLGGVGWRPILPELMELGVRHATVNIPLNSLFSLTPAPGKLRFDHEGLILYVHESGLAHYDRLIHFLSTNQIVVSAVILVPFGGEAPVVERLLHPEANRAGHYAMPNFTSAQGVKLYGGMLAFLAERYAQAGDPHGRITNWIMHNEIDYGWEWTNMGAQPREIYLDSYVRSMRLAYYTARRFNPQARVFISLTHSWNVAPDPAWKTYAPRRLLEDLGRYSRLEGDFEWGVAYHPYPQSLFKPDTWNDQLATHSMDTRMITMKNIEVLDAFMKREDMLYQASKVRGILLSEQGFHTPGYSERAERLQAAALVYTWQQMRELDSIEAFHNHRWVDHPQEGGLLLGLRRLPSTEFPQGQKKFAWEIYQALETDREEAMTRFARELINAE